jgi:hypothetical protein
VILFGKYQVCFLDLVTDGKTGKFDGNKIWQHVCYGILSYCVLTSPITWELMATYGSIVGGSRVAMAFLKYKYRDGASNDKVA